MCVYMPYDNRWRDTNFEEYVEVLQEVERLIYDQDPEYVVFGGDLNTGLSWASPHNQALSEFVRNYQMGVCIEMDQANVPYTYISPNGDTSKVDHVIICSNISDHIVSCNIIDSIHSDPVPIKTVIELEIPIRPSSGNVSDSGILDPYVAWHRAEDQHINAYKELLHHQLSELAMSCNMEALRCSDVCVPIMLKRCRTSIIVLLRHVMILPESVYPPLGGTPGRSD